MVWHIFAMLAVYAILVKTSNAMVGLKKCGENYCKADEYCSTFTNHCEGCSNICNSNSHNYDESLCESKCPQEVLAQLESQQHRNLVLIIILFVIILLYAVFKLFKWWRRWRVPIKRDPNNDNAFTQANPHVESPRTMKKLSKSQAKSISPTEAAEGSTVFTISTPISTRYPAENSTEDYSYDNGALNISTNVSTKE